MRHMLTALLFCLLAAPAFAEDGADDIIGLKTGGLTLSNDADLARISERLEISPTSIHADYTFRNTGSQAVSTLVVFSMPDVKAPNANLNAVNVESDDFLDYAVKQNGASINPERRWRAFVGTIDLTDVLAAAGVPPNPLSTQAERAVNALTPAMIEDWQARGLIVPASYGDGKTYLPAWTLKSAFQWQVEIAAGAELRIEHDYAPSLGSRDPAFLLDRKSRLDRKKYAAFEKAYCLTAPFRQAVEDGLTYPSGEPKYHLHTLSYALAAETAAAPIQSFDLEVKGGDAAQIVSFCGKGVKQTTPEAASFSAKDFSPEHDLDIVFLVPSNFE